MVGAATAVMFFGENQGRARAAIERYTTAIPGASLAFLEEITDPAMGNVGDVLRSEVHIGDARLILFDNGFDHAFGITPAISLWLDLSSDEEIEAVYAALREGGDDLMPLGEYGFSRRFAWVRDPFGVTWQLNLPFAS